MEDLLEGSWLFDDGPLGSASAEGLHGELPDERLLSMLPPLLPGMLDDLACVAPPVPGGARGGGAAVYAREAAPPGRPAGAEDAARAALLASSADGGVWRCLNRSHPEDCSRCLPAPGPAAAADWVLVGDKSVKSGEKKLRSLLSRTPEWGSEATRCAAAADAEAGGDDVLAALLRSRDASALRKLHFLALCQRWRYRSDAWVPREVARKRAREASPQPQPRQTLAQPAGYGAQAMTLAAWPPGQTQAQAHPQPQLLPDAALEGLRGALRGALQHYIFLTDDSRVHAVAQREPRAPLVTWTVLMLDSVLSIIRGFASVTTADAFALNSRCAALAAGAGSGGSGDEMTMWTPWWLSDDYELLARTDSHFALLQTMLQAYFAGLRNLRRPGAAPLSAPDAVIAEGWVGSVGALNALCSIAQSALAHARLSLSTAGYVHVASEAMAAMAGAVQHMLRLHDARRAWCSSRESGMAAKGNHVPGHFWPAVAVAARERVIPSATYTQPRLTYALEAFASQAPNDGDPHHPKILTMPTLVPFGTAM